MEVMDILSGITSGKVMILVKKTIFATSYHFDSFLVKMIFIFQNVSEFGQFTSLRELYLCKSQVIITLFANGNNYRLYFACCFTHHFILFV